ncbi:hypothetical protein RUND412_008410 [Rhizina undulata]
MATSYPSASEIHLTHFNFKYEWDGYTFQLKQQEIENGGSMESALLPVFRNIFVIRNKFKPISVNENNLGSELDFDSSLLNIFLLGQQQYDSHSYIPGFDNLCLDFNISSTSALSQTDQQPLEDPASLEFPPSSFSSKLPIVPAPNPNSTPPAPQLSQGGEVLINREEVFAKIFGAIYYDGPDIHDKISEKPTSVYQEYLSLKEKPGTPELVELANKVIDYLEKLHKDNDKVLRLTLSQRLGQVISLLKLCKGTVYNLTKPTQFQRCMLTPHKEERVFENNQMWNLNRKKDTHYSMLLDITSTTRPTWIGKQVKQQVLNNAESSSTSQRNKRRLGTQIESQETMADAPELTISAREESSEVPKRTELSTFWENYEVVDSYDTDSV